MQTKLRFTKVRKVKTPAYGTAGSAGIDFFVPDDFTACSLSMHKDVLIPSGIKARVPDGYALIAYNKSGVSTKQKLAVGACVVDSDYQGEIHLHVYNFGNDWAKITPGMKLVQFLLVPVPSAELIECSRIDEVFPTESKRGAGGFGSTDSKSDALEATR